MRIGMGSCALTEIVRSSQTQSASAMRHKIVLNMAGTPNFSRSSLSPASNEFCSQNLSHRAFGQALRKFDVVGNFEWGNFRPQAFADLVRQRLGGRLTLCEHDYRADFVADLGVGFRNDRGFD